MPTFNVRAAVALALGVVFQVRQFRQAVAQGQMNRPGFSGDIRV